MAEDSKADGTATSVLVLALATLLGIPLVAYLWETVNQLLNGLVDGGRLALSVPGGLLLLALLYAAGRAFSRMAAPRPAGATSGAEARAARGAEAGAAPGAEAGAAQEAGAAPDAGTGGAAEAEPNVAGALLLSSLVLMFIFGVWLMMYVFLLGR